MNKSTTVEFANDQKPIRIPTGFFIQSFSFVNANDVNFVGYIWMIFPHTLPDDFTQKFIFPEEVQSNSTRTELIYTLEQEDYTLNGWFFDVIVRQSFDYTNYPLDYQSIWLVSGAKISSMIKR